MNTNRPSQQTWFSLNWRLLFFFLTTMVAFSFGRVYSLAQTSPENAPPEKQQNAKVVRVMTFNLRYASSSPPNAWPDRKPIMAELLKDLKPDLIGTQEGVYHQLKDLHRDLPAYDWIGLGRDGGSRGEFMAVFFRKERFEPLEYDHFWLSDTPSVVASTTWGHSNRRMVTWVRFLDRQQQREFYFWNTHLDHANQSAREKGAALIRERIEALKTDLPIILTGDFNAVSRQNKAYDILVPEPFTDTWFLARKRTGEGLGTFNGFRQIPRNNRRIDWILFRGNATVLSSEVVSFSKDGQFPSDHFPVMIDLILQTP